MGERGSVAAGHDLLYQDLPQEVLDVSSRIGLKRRLSNEATNTFLKKRLPEKVENELRYQTYLLREPVRGASSRAQKHQEQNTDNKSGRKKGKRKHGLNASQRKKLFDISKSRDLKFSTFEEVNHLWEEYIDSVIEDIKSPADEANLVKADYHGAYLVVSASRNPSLVGLKGIVVQETKHTFRLIDCSNRVVVIPKQGTMFAFERKRLVYKLCGNYLRLTPHQRSRAKLKSRREGDDI